MIDEKWDRLRVICRQPYTKNKQFGLQFIDIIADTKPAKESPNTRRHPTQSLSAFKKYSEIQTLPSFSWFFLHTSAIGICTMEVTYFIFQQTASSFVPICL